MIKTVFDINQEERWNTLIGNLKNVVKRMKEINSEYSLEVVIMGTAINGIKKLSDIVEKDDLEELINQKVVFSVCNNTMKKYNVKKDELYDFIQIVPAGVIELVLKQQEGYSYIKP
ncbi:DsrE family protein [Cetobacterium somerae]|uniref:DsrE family protein n=1 Tax=Cetobacterium sp. NK01 TaxID=2993530 RepID=UPI0021171D38|nr:DsrE family protein [Cetobacterium sp. NK01]MCQ8213569.1 DsrE family protein [Cetobacterium sp. NK01]